MSKLSENIKYYRKDGKLTQKALSEKLNVSNKTLSHWENDFATVHRTISYAGKYF